MLNFYTDFLDIRNLKPDKEGSMVPGSGLLKNEHRTSNV